MEVPTLTDALDETFSVFRSTGNRGEPLTTAEVTEHLDISRRSTYARLQRLVDEGLLDTKKAGARGRVWWRPPEDDRGEGDSPSPAAEGDQEVMLGRLIDNLPAMVYRRQNEPGWPMSYVSESCRAVSGYTAEAVANGEVSWSEDVIHPDDRARVRDAVAEGLATGGQFACEYRIETADGETRWMWERGCTLDAEGRESDVIEGAVVDVTAQRESAASLARTDEQFRALVDATEEYAIFVLDRDGCVATWNPGARRIKGYEKDEVVGEHFSTFYTAADREAGIPEANLAAAVEDGQTTDEGWRVREDGSRFWAAVTISAIRDEDGTLQGFAKVTREMTERREFEQRLRDERDFTRQVLETAPASIFVVEASGAIVEANDRFWRQLGLDPDTASLSIGDLTLYDGSGERIPTDERPYRTVFETGEAVADWRCQIELPTGERRWVSLNIAPIEDDGEVASAVVAAQDVTQLTEQARQLERQRDDVASELEDVFTRIDDAFLALDDDWRITYVNEQAATLVGLSVEEMLGTRVWDTLFEIAEGRPRELAERAIETQETVQYEYYSAVLGRWFETRIYPSESGLSVYFRDVTERKERESNLELYETIVSAIEDGVYVLDDDFHFVKVNDAYAEMTGYDREELLGAHYSLVAGDEVSRESTQRLEEMLAGETDSATLEADIHRKDGDRLRAESRFTPLPPGATERPSTVGVVRDVSERVERERQLEESRRRYQTLVEHFPNGAVALVDEDLHYRTVGGTPVDQVDRSAPELEGLPIREALDAELADILAPRYEAALAGDRSTFEAELDDGIYQFWIVPVRDDDGEVFAALGMSQDVTDRRDRERELREAKAQLEAATDAGAVATWEWHIPDDRLVGGASFARIFGLDAEAVRDGVPVERYLGAIHEDDRERVRRQIDEAVAARGEYESEYRVQDANGDRRWVVARGRVECDEDGEPITFPGALTDITDRKQAELALERQRSQLAALNNLNEVVRDITEAAIDQSTREEIEQVVCDAIAESDSYEFAWTGDVHVPTETVDLRAEAGVDGYLDPVEITVDPDDPRSEGPTGRALRTGEIQTTQDIQADERHEPWREHLEQYDVQSSAAIPLVHEGTVYGVLNVYADRPHAFGGEERAVIGQLGEIVGHAIAAVERKRALMSDEVVELEFRITDIFDVFGIDGPADGRIELSEAVPIGNDDYLIYGHTTAPTRESVRSLVETVFHWEELRFRRDEGDSKFEVRLSDPPVLSTLASFGGSIESAVIENGDYHMTLHVSPSADTRQLIDVVRSTYPTAEMLTRRQVTRPDGDDDRVQSVITEELTDRQQAALRAAYHADFFEWPREATGEDLADALDVSPPTFHQHLRKAERKVFDSLLSGGDKQVSVSD